MEREQTKKIIAVMMATFPNYHPVDLTATVNTWTIMLEEYSYEEVSMALKAFVTSDTSGFAPSPGQLIERIKTISTPQSLSETEAWLLVSKALRNGSYGAQEEFEKLPPIIQKCIGSSTQLRNWAQTKNESVENVIQSNFMRTYRTEVKRAEEIEKMPTEIKKMIGVANTGRYLEIQDRQEIQIEEKPMPVKTEMSSNTMKKLETLYENLVD